MNTQTKPIDVYTIVTTRIIAQMEKGVIPWRKTWTEGGHPQNLVSKYPYRGMNVWMLASHGYSQNYFLTWRQLKELGGSVKKGEKGHVVIFWKKPKEQEAVEGQQQKPAKAILRYYLVYNIAQVEGLPEILSIPYESNGLSRIDICDEIIERMPNCPAIKHNKQKAYYDCEKDYINMPKQGSFDSAESYYDTLYHELVHATGHSTRLNRKEITEPTTYSSEPYSIEELTAEIGACYLNSISGISERVFDNNVAYIDGWLKVLRNDKRLIVYASTQAQRATDFILNVPPYQEAAVMRTAQEIETQ